MVELLVHVVLDPEGGAEADGSAGGDSFNGAVETTAALAALVEIGVG